MSNFQDSSGGDETLKLPAPAARVSGSEFDLTREEVRLAEGVGAPGSINLGETAGIPLEIVGTSRNLAFPELSREVIEERLAALAKISHPNQQMKAAQELSKLLFGDLDKAIHFVATLAEKVMDGSWTTATNFNPNGFFKMSVAKADGVALRLHFNSRQEQIPEGGRIEENVHDHRWAFVSTLLTGKFQHTLFHTLPAGSAEEGVELHKYSYAPRDGKDYFTMNYEGPDRLRVGRIVEPPVFKPFQLMATSIHRAAYPLQDTEMTVTAVVTLENAKRDFNYVWATDHIRAMIEETEGRTKTPECGVDAQLRLLGELSTALHAKLPGSKR